jgi:hypothetical protein
MNRRYVRPSLGDDPVSAAAAAAIAGAASVASSGATGKSTPPKRHRRKHRSPSASTTTDAATDVSPSSVPTASAGAHKPTGKKVRKPSHRPQRGNDPAVDTAPGDKTATTAAQPDAGHGHLLLIGGAVVGLGLLALLLTRHDDQPAPDAKHPRMA